MRGIDPIQTGYVTSDGFNIYYEVYGEGQPMVLVHGWGADSYSNWVSTGWVQRLADIRKVICIDVRGHGRSDKPYALEPYGYAAMCQDVLAVMDALQISQADYLGYSMGAFMGAHLLGHHGQRFASMVLGGIGDETPASAAQGEVIARALRATDAASSADPVASSVRAFVQANSSNDLQALAYSAAQMWPQGYPLALVGSDVVSATVRVLIVNGENDHPYVDSADKLAQVLQRVLQECTHITIPGTDHLTTVSDERFKQVVVDFLSSH